MSNLADKTAKKALCILAKAVRSFEGLHYLDMTKEDSWDACKARRLMEGIIQSNGYSVNYDKDIKTSIIKTDNDQP